MLSDYIVRTSKIQVSIGLKTLVECLLCAMVHMSLPNAIFDSEGWFIYKIVCSLVLFDFALRERLVIQTGYKHYSLVS